MNHKFATILISGAGQLGSRYLQGLAKSRIALRIYVQDCFPGSLRQAEERWKEVVPNKGLHSVSYHTNFEQLPEEVDIAIVSTTADVRSSVVGEISKTTTIRYWVLEKVLAQSEIELDEIMTCIPDARKSWVNTPRRMMSWYKQIKSQHEFSSPIELKVQGKLGCLGSNAIHFLDLLAWWSGETLQYVYTDKMCGSWIESKRKGFWEALGRLEAEFSGGSIAILEASKDSNVRPIMVRNREATWQIDESGKLATCSSGIEIQGRITYQSEMSASLVESILESGNCELPTLEDSAALHRVFLNSLQEHWNRDGHPLASSVPIT